MQLARSYPNPSVSGLKGEQFDFNILIDFDL